MKKLLFLILLLIPLAGFCKSNEKQYYFYNIVSFEGDFTKENFRVYYDNGTEVKKLKEMKFKTPAGALMFFLSQGWEMYLNGATSEGASFHGTGASETRSYWILRKPCSREEFHRAVTNAIVK